MNYPVEILAIYRDMKELEDIGWEEQATTREVAYLADLEIQINILERQLDRECLDYELEVMGKPNNDRWYDLFTQFGE